MTIRKGKIQSEFAEKLERKQRKESDGNFRISLADFCRNQKYGSSFRDWQNDSLLSHALDVLEGYCKRPLESQLDGKKFVLYGGWPANSLFDCPDYLGEDAKWARIHINGKSVIAGHIIENTFYIVFLDKTHAFFPMRDDNRRK